MIARRTFLQYSAGAGLLLGAGSLLQAPAWADPKRVDTGSAGRRKAVRPRKSGDVVVENKLNASEEGQSDGPGPMEGAQVNPHATRFVYTGFDGDGTVRFGPLSRRRAESQLCSGVPLDVSTMTVEYQDAHGVKLDEAIIRGVHIVP